VSVRDVERLVCEAAELAGATVCALHAHDLATLRRDFLGVADALGVAPRGARLCADFDARLDAVQERVRGAAAPRVALLEWLEPPMIAGGWIPEIARIAGAEPVIVTEPRHFRTVSWDDVCAAEPELVVFLPCGWGVERTLAELERPEAGGPAARLAGGASRGGWILDGDALFNRPGPRLGDSAEVLARVVHPGRFGGGAASLGRLASPWPRAAAQRTISVPSAMS
jgi:iron complex transport system substrate-binding protein